MRNLVYKVHLDNPGISIEPNDNEEFTISSIILLTSFSVTVDVID